LLITVLRTVRTDELAGLPLEEIDLVDDVDRKLPALDLGAEVEVNERQLRRLEVEARREPQLRDELVLLHIIPDDDGGGGSFVFRRIHRHGRRRKAINCPYEDERPYIAGRYSTYIIIIIIISSL
jgi:hypothetical protein